MTARLVCGVDEVGRGALAGPMMAVAAVFECDDVNSTPIQGVKDSKKFHNEGNRETVFGWILRDSHLIDVGLGIVDVEEINRFGIDEANDVAFSRAMADLNVRPMHIYVDGKKPIKNIPAIQQTVEPKADVRYWPVSAASIIAKVVRDRLMSELSRVYPSYAWQQNKGYGSETHQEALKKYGATPYHRKQFVKNILKKA